jgi:hypothetical protein
LDIKMILLPLKNENNMKIIKGTRRFYPQLKANCETSFEMIGGYTLHSNRFYPYIVLTTLDQVIGCESLGQIKKRFPNIKAIVI